jgi:hypothetical protein
MFSLARSAECVCGWIASAGVGATRASDEHSPTGRASERRHRSQQGVDDAAHVHAERHQLDLVLEDLRGGTLAPARRASDIPIAMACLRLVTFYPDDPLLSFSAFSSCSAEGQGLRPRSLPSWLG